jgi:hypothetical protein
MTIHKFMATLLALLIAFSMTVLPAEAKKRRDDRRSSTTQQVLKKALIGAGVGAVIGGITSRGENRKGGIIKGALIGGAAGGAYGLISQRRNNQQYYNDRDRYGYQPNYYTNYGYPQPYSYQQVSYPYGNYNGGNYNGYYNNGNGYYGNGYNGYNQYDPWSDPYGSGGSNYNYNYSGF